MVLRNYLHVVTVGIVNALTNRGSIDLHDVGLDMRNDVVTRPELVPVSLQVLLPCGGIYRLVCAVDEYRSSSIGIGSPPIAGDIQ